ncbi:MAG: S8 family serine peptidase [Thermofilaceae archaeon]
MIAVGAIDSSYNVPSWSNRNPYVVAPGVSIYSTLPKEYSYMSGSSVACPHVLGVAALVQALRLATGKSRLSPDAMKLVLTTTARDLDSGATTSSTGTASSTRTAQSSTRSYGPKLGRSPFLLR